MYKVVELFTDLQDNDYLYQPGDEFPRAGLLVSGERLAELASMDNRRGIVLIQKVPEKAKNEAEKAKKPLVEESVEKPKKSSKKAKKKEG